ncbi:MAG: hypothetical protein RBT74_09830 [Tenuifilaceae bacterium]|jgi:hypothetical protein|nr:hypothetical protein [Tenuifilaceae bacterium]
MKFFTFVLIILTVNLTQAQENYLCKRNNLKFGHSITPKYLQSDYNLSLGNFRLEATYGGTNFFEFGGYLGYSRFVNFLNTEETESSNNQISPGTFIYSNAFTYGITANFHLLPLIANSAEPRFDVYLSAKFGGLSLAAPEGSVYKGHGADYGLYGGLSYYITPYWGAFVEYGFNNRPEEYNIESCLRYGLTVKF